MVGLTVEKVAAESDDFWMWARKAG